MPMYMKLKFTSVFHVSAHLRAARFSLPADGRAIATDVENEDPKKRRLLYLQNRGFE